MLRSFPAKFTFPRYKEKNNSTNIALKDFMSSLTDIDSDLQSVK